MAKKKRGTGSGKRSHRASTKITKTHRRTIPLSRGEDLVWEDMQHELKKNIREEEGRNNVMTSFDAEDPKERRIGATDDSGLTRTNEQPIDVDLPGSGQHYCICCARYFIDAESLKSHFKTKAHKKRMRDLGRIDSIRPHTQLDAEIAAGMGIPDNGINRTRSMEIEK